MLTIKIRQAIILTATTMFFVVAATSQLQGDAATESFMKAGVACLVLTCLGMAFLGVVEDALQKVSSPTQHAQPSGAKPVAVQAGKDEG